MSASRASADVVLVQQGPFNVRNHNGVSLMVWSSRQSVHTVNGVYVSYLDDLKAYYVAIAFLISLITTHETQHRATQLVLST